MDGGNIFFPGFQTGKQQPHHARLQCIRRAADTVAGDLRPLPGQVFPCQRVEIVVLAADDSRRAGNILPQRRIDLLQLRQHLLAQAIAGKGHTVVGLVLHVSQRVALQIQFDLLPRRVQQRSDQPPALWRNTGQTLGTRAPQQIQQHRLRLIAHMVGGGNALCADLIGHLFQIGIAQQPAGLFHPAPHFSRHRYHVRAVCVERYAQIAAQLADKVLVTLGGRAHMVVIMGCRHAEAARIGNTAQIVQQTHGVPSAGHGAQNGAAGLRQHIPLFHPGQKLHGGPPKTA